MKTNMAWTAVVRTIVQGTIGMLLNSSLGEWIVARLTDFGLTFNRDVLVNAVTLFMIGAIVWLVNTFGPKFAWINQLVSLGLSRTGPAYVPNNADAIVSVANKASDDTITTVDTPPVEGPNDAAPPAPPLQQFDPGYNPGETGYKADPNI